MAPLPLILLTAGAAALVAWVLTRAMHRVAIARRMMDVPNHRSSHTHPVPRGGGVAIVVVCIATAVVVAALVPAGRHLTIALVGGGAPVALIGWRDDVHDVPPVVRLCVHAVAALWAVLWIGGGSGMVGLPAAITVPLAVPMIMWAVSLYNFMDGSDGLAGVEAVAVGAGGALLLAVAGAPEAALLSLCAATGAAGFLPVNWAPARLFMGDVGSGFLGFWFGVLGLYAAMTRPAAGIAWAILLGAFLFDATVTLLRRLVRGVSVHSAHREHAYQRAITAGRSHAQVAITLAAINGALFLLALTALRSTVWTVTASAAAIALLASIYLSIERIAP